MKIYRLANDAPRPGPTPIIKMMRIILIKIHLILFIIPITTAIGCFTAIFLVKRKYLSKNRMCLVVYKLNEKCIVMSVMMTYAQCIIAL